ncbi:putative FMN-dependent luciferase-like monooxygenase [Nocardiopsis alba]|uniref:putative FMN-dependent luciferase-like monooxygenase n=1 Tax=Nocardiopsis alba TaxID=53437 RepID=UPI00034951B8|nr:putative FMN-dependent luciferase-like monooxygenase [Nocardiopsis alba]
MPEQLGFFTRVLDDAPPAERYRLALEQIRHAEALGYDSAWVAQHHFDGDEGGLPSPLVFLARAAARTERIRLGTGVVTLPLEDPIRVAEDASVLDLLSEGRLEVGIGSGGTPSTFPSFGVEFTERREVFARKREALLAALAGEAFDGTSNRLHPARPELLERLWFATFSSPLAVTAAERGDGLMLSRTQPRPAEAPETTLWDIQNPIIDAYLDHLAPGAAPRISVARTLFVADDRQEALRLAEHGYRNTRFARSTLGDEVDRLPVEELLARLDAHVGTPEDVLESLSRDTALRRATHLSFQVHSVDPPHEYVLRSMELIATRVAPELGWTRNDIDLGA